MGKTRDTGFLNNCVFTDSSNNVGIGAAASGSFKLQVTGTTNLTGALTGVASTFLGKLTIGSSSLAEGEIGIFETGGNYNFTTFKNGTVRTIIGSQSSTSQGFLGTASTHDLLIKTNDTTRLTIAASTGAATFSSSVTAGAGSRLIVSGSMLLGEIVSSYSTIESTTGNGIWLRPAGVSSPSGMFLNTSGNVGIGTSSPDVALLVGGTSTLSATANPTAIALDNSYFNGTTSGDKLKLYILRGGVNIGFGAGNIGDFNIWCDGLTRFYNGGTERMRITSGGDVGIGNTAFASTRLTVSGKDNTSSNYSFVANNASNSNLFLVRNDGAIALSTFTYGNTVSGSPRTTYIESSGFLGGISSVKASKKNIENVSNVDWIYELNPVTFNYRKKDEEGNYTDDTYKDLNYGLIAEDTAPIADFLVNYNDKEDGTKEMIGIEYMRLITPMLKAIQELKARIKQLENK